MFREYKVKDVMNTEIVVVSPEEKIKSVARLMKDKNASEVLVAEDRKIKGIVTLRDIVYGIASNAKLQDPVLEIMTTELVTANKEEKLVDAVKRMREFNIGRLPVVDDDNNLVGIVTEKTLIKTIPSIVELLYEGSEICGEPAVNPGESMQEGICESCGNYSEMLREKNGLWLCETCWSEEE